jgi:uncharacterized protein (TIGR02646 family)
MRPVKKWIHTDATIIPPINEFYNPYQDAKPDLERNIDAYCSYCERPAQDEAVHVEHIQPKGLSQYFAKKYLWSNFLLACARCNGADNKSEKDVVFGTIHLPNLNNTAISIIYGEGGFVQVNNTLHNQELANAVALINLVGLDKRPGHPNHLHKDKRWDRRREVWEIAKRNLIKYDRDLIDAYTILDLARGYGFWSVWFSLFRNSIEVKQLLVTNFRGTESKCFNSDFNPINRNPGHENDTV